ncbi:unnamed protein product, partial [Notodromas monacha]
MSESALYDLQQEFRQASQTLEWIVADVRSPWRMKEVFEKYKPQLVFHAAAYKHVPLMESHPWESVITNVYGTKVVADLATQHKVEKFIMVSTDKAVNPTNVMGATKRLAEIPIKIIDLAKKMIRLLGHRYPQDVDIKIIGLRPGEKIYEELLADGENTIETYHPKIRLAEQHGLMDCESTMKIIEDIFELAHGSTQSHHQLVAAIKSIIPEYVSNNS